VRGIVLPLQPIGWSPEHGGLPGTLSLAADCWPMPGSPSPLGGAGRRAAPADPEQPCGNPPAMAVAPCGCAPKMGCWSPPPLGGSRWSGRAGAGRRRGTDWHAGWIETSVMLQLRPDLVRMDRAVPGTWHHPEGLPPNGPRPGPG